MLFLFPYVNLEDASVNYNNERQWWGKEQKVLSPVIKWHMIIKWPCFKPHLWANHGFYTGDLDFSTDAEWKKWESDYEYILDFAQLANKRT
jgi:hypothetical protein